MTLVPNLRCHKLCVCKFWWLKYGYFPHKSMGKISVLLPVVFPDEDYCSSLHQSTGGGKWRHFQRELFMEQYNLSWTLWMQKMVLGKSWRHLRAATINNHGCLRSSVCMCTHIHACRWFQIKYVTRNKSYAKGKAWSWPRHDSFILNLKLGWSLADGTNTVTSPLK